MDRARRAELIARYRAGADAVDAALAGAGDAELDAVPQDEGWSPRMVVHHLANSESNSYLRLRKLLAEDRPIARATTRRSTHAGCTTTGRSMDDWLEI